MLCQKEATTAGCGKNTGRLLTKRWIFGEFSPKNPSRNPRWSEKRMAALQNCKFGRETATKIRNRWLVTLADWGQVWNSQEIRSSSENLCQKSQKRWAVGQRWSVGAVFWKFEQERWLQSVPKGWTARYWSVEAGCLLPLSKITQFLTPTISFWSWKRALGCRKKSEPKFYLWSLKLTKRCAVEDPYTSEKLSPPFLPFENCEKQVEIADFYTFSL